MHDGFDLRPSKMEDLDSSCAWLEGFPVTASFGPAGPLIQQLRSLTTVANVVSKDEIQMLAKNLEVLCISLMHQSEAAEPSFMARCWMSEVRELCYDTKNYLDDAPFIISKQDDDDDDDGAQLTPQEKQENAQFEFQMLEARVMHASKRRERYGFDQQQCIINKPKLVPSAGRRRHLVSFQELTLIDGDRLDNLGNLIWRKDEGQQLKVVSLVGLEGVGKTTLAKRIYHHFQTCGQFQCRAFAKVSRNPDMRRLLTTIFTQIQIQLPPDFSSSPSSQPPAPAGCLDAQDLIANIQHHLRHKRYLIIIDDLWSASVWDIIRRAFPDNGCHSRIITTTQFEDVASACCSYQSKYMPEIKPLKHGQSQELFFSMFGSESQVGLPKDFGEVSYEIIQKCGGLPLSIVNIASMLPAPSKQNLQEWMDIRDSLPSTLRANPTPEGIKQVLNLIYNNLTPQLKTCLLYLVLYPEGCTIIKDDLAQQWVVEGIIEEGQNKEEVAGGYFDELVSRGMIQVVDNYLGVLSCTLHHMVYELIVKKSVEENFIIVVDYSQPAIGLPPKVRRLSVQFGGARSARIPAGIMVSEIRSLAFFGFCGCADFIEEYKLLRVLVLHVWDDQGDATFEFSGISKLLALRYLKIECNTAVKLPVPAQFGDLQHLEVDTPVLVIPSDIGGLGRLSSLKIAVRAISMEDIHILQKLEALSALSLHVWTTPVEMIVFDKGGFLVLKSFEFRCPVPWLKFEAGSMHCLRNLNLCFNANEADRHGTATISIEHLPGLKEITAHIWVSDIDVGSTFRTVISNHSSNPIIDMQLVHPIFHGDTTTSAGTIKVKDEKKQAADNRMSTLPQLKRTVNLLGSSSCVPVQGADKNPKMEKDIAQSMSELEVGSESEDMGTEQSMPSSPTNNQTDMKWEPGCEDENKQADIRMCTSSPGSSSRVPDSGRKIDVQPPTKMSLSAAIGAISGFNECATLWQWAKSVISSLHSRWSGSQEQDLQGRVLQLESGLQLLSDTLPAMHDLINKAEWRSHDDVVASLLPNLKDTVFDAEDLLDEFEWYEKKVQVEGNASHSPFIDFFDTVIQGSFNKLSDVQFRLNHLSSQLDNMGLHGVTQHFDKLVRPETTSLPNETKIVGRDEKLEKVLGFLNVPTNSKRKRATSSINASASTSASNHVSKESRISSLPVLPIAGIGGVGKTTLAQHIFNHQRVKSHFEPKIWISVSDDFDVKRLTKEAIESCTEKEVTTDNLDYLQRALSNHVSNKRLLIVLDDMWDDALKENGQCWKRFCAPFRSVQEGSVMLVTTRCSKVTEGVRTMEPIILEGLKDDVLWSFFKSCVFGSESSDNDPELESIGRRILPKLKGSPLAAKTLGRMLSMNLQASHWNSILESELWELKQEETDILPALCLSYMYLPFYLKRCFAFCAVYPKHYRFSKASLAEIWVAEGYVDPQGGVPNQDIGCQYFEDLVARSFFQKVSGAYASAYYVIDDLMHDMLQKVSEHDCFILRNKSDFDKVPQNVRHLYVHPSNDFDDSCLLRLCKHTKLRTLICKKDLGEDTCSVMDHWCTKFLRMRVISCAFTKELPDSISNWKHLRHLKISKACPLMERIPSTFFCLYNLQILYATNSMLESLPGDFCKLISLQKFISHGLAYHVGGHTTLDLIEVQGQGIRLIKNLNQFRGHLNIKDPSKDQAAEAELKNKNCLVELTLDMDSQIISFLGSQIIQNNENNETEDVIQVLQPPINLKSLILGGYAGVSLPSWFQPQNLPSLKSLTFVCCFRLESISFLMISQSINLNDIPATGIFLYLTDLTIDRCRNISSVEDFLHSGYVPAIKKIRIESCQMLASIPTEKFADFHFLEHFEVLKCPSLNWQRGFVLPSSLQSLSLKWSGDISPHVPSCLLNLTSLASLSIAGCQGITSIPGDIWRSNLASLEKLAFQDCPNLVSIGGANAVAQIKNVWISECPNLEETEQMDTSLCLR